ncbi:MAG: TIGR02328 family protein [Bacillota bacterium]|nr:TIGR02328 family protein [Bacillota bacterium]MDP4159668.1 TIGR02328 family protein [Bacillota bacterium]
MRLWHQDLITKLPRQQLLGQHRECCALRGKGWGKKHATVDYVFKHSPARLYEYHRIVMNEMITRGYKPDKIWYNPNYRGKNLSSFENDILVDPLNEANYINQFGNPIYPEHNYNYLKECIENLKNKGLVLKI